MRLKFNQPAPDGERFARDAFEGQIGKEIPVNMPGGPRSGRIVAAKTANDGQSVELTLDVAMQIPPFGSGSFGPR
ncbi:hypothetical protein ACFXCZ_27130 [Streptomyces sp. NPDC059396]|uniref:hypothetical protein n=1 Tax=Streptomyces sp. NPDC059396 TaxID=3346819 RepID=UPI0036B3E9EA